jgi:chemotaxis protein CheC
VIQADLHLDILTELVNIGVGRAAASLSELVGHRVELRVPLLRTLAIEELLREFAAEHHAVDLAVTQDFRGGLDGRAILAFPSMSAVKLGQLLSGVDGEDDELTEDLAGVLEEVGNIVLNGVLGTFGNMSSCDLNYSVPRLTRSGGIARMMGAGESDAVSRVVLLANTHFCVAERNIEGSLILLFDLSRLDCLVTQLARQSRCEPATGAQATLEIAPCE